MYDKLLYIGKSRCITVDLFASRTSVRISKDHPYVFRSTDILSDEAIKYYKSLKPQGVVLGGCNDDKDEAPSEKVTPEVDTTEVESVEESAETPVEEDATTEEDTSEPEVEESSDEDEATTEEVTQDETPVEVEIPSDVTQEELIEYLDLNYDDNTIKDLARDAGVKRVQSAWDKMTTINKILETNVAYVSNLIRS